MTEDRGKEIGGAGLGVTLRAWAEADPPPAPPVEEIWAAVRAELVPFGKTGETGWSRREVRSPAGRPRRTAGLRVRAAALAAALLAGVLLGRWTAPVGSSAGGGEPGESSAVQAPQTVEPPSTALRLAATRHLLLAGPLLTRLAGGSDPERGTVPPEIQEWARALLTDTRLLLDARWTGDPELRGLLEDLELILTQVASLPTPAPSADRMRLELELITAGVQDRRLLSRIRALSPPEAAQQ